MIGMLVARKDCWKWLQTRTQPLLPRVRFPWLGLKADVEFLSRVDSGWQTSLRRKRPCLWYIPPCRGGGYWGFGGFVCWACSRLWLKSKKYTIRCHEAYGCSLELWNCAEDYRSCGKWNEINSLKNYTKSKLYRLLLRYTFKRINVIARLVCGSNQS